MLSISAGSFVILGTALLHNSKLSAMNYNIVNVQCPLPVKSSCSFKLIANSYHDDGNSPAGVKCLCKLWYPHVYNCLL